MKPRISLIFNDSLSAEVFCKDLHQYVPADTVGTVCPLRWMVIKLQSHVVTIDLIQRSGPANPANLILYANYSVHAYKVLLRVL